jgi:hypothetical protein
METLPKWQQCLSIQLLLPPFCDIICNKNDVSIAYELTYNLIGPTKSRLIFTNDSPKRLVINIAKFQVDKFLMH